MADQTETRDITALNLITPADGCALITPADSDLTTYLRGIAFATAGALKVTMVNGDVVVIPSGALAAGMIHPLRIKRVWSTGTTAASIVGFY